MKKTVALLAAACLLIACLAACQMPDPKDNEVSNEADKTTDTAAPQESTAAVPNGGEIPENYFYLPVKAEMKFESERETVEYQYNENGHLVGITTTYPDGQTETTEYAVDESGNLLRDSMFIGDGILTIDYEYDENGRPIRSTDTYPDGRTSTEEYEYEFDASGNVIREIRIASSGVKIFTDYEYDTNGNQIKCTTTLSEKNKMILENEYDDSGNLIRKIQNVIDNGEAQPPIVIDYSYDEYGKQIFEEGYEYTCDENGNLTKTFTDGEATVTIEYRLIHTPNGIPDWMLERIP